MASQDVLSEDGLYCPVCKKILEEPVLLSCKHNFCINCIQTCWRENPNMKCPLCKKRDSKSEPPGNFELEQMCKGVLQHRASTEPEEVCTLHFEKIQLFCMDHQQPVCHTCLELELHNDHWFTSIDEAAQRHKAEVQKSLEPLKENLKVLQKAEGDWVQTAEQMKVQAQETERQITETFEKVQKVLKEEKEARICSLKQDENKTTQVMEENIASLNRSINNISDSIKTVEEELEAPDVSFLLKYKTTAEIVQQPLPQEPQWPSGDQTDVTKHLGHFKTNLWDKFQQILEPSMIECVAPREDPTVHPRQDPTVHPREDPTVHPREDPTVSIYSALRKYACKLTLDPNTVNYQLSLSEDNRMVIYGDHKQSYPVHPDRFTSWPQVLCGEDLTRRCYWEVDWKGEVYIGVTYRGISRRGGGEDSCLGRNKKSWVLLCKDNDYTAWHDNMPTPIPVSSECKRIVVYVDWPAGSLSFYTVSSDTLTHLHTFYCTFTEPLVPGFWVWGSGSSASLCQI